MFYLLALLVAEPQTYVSPRVSAPVKIDGVIDSQWDQAPWTQDFVDIEGDRKPKPRFRTRAKMMWDAQYFYVAAELVEPHVWGTLTQHDAVIFHDNDFELFVDPNGDSHEYFEFEINALNTGWDLFLPKPYKDGGSADNGWEIPGLRTAVAVRGTLNDARDADAGWSVEIAIPWAAFGSRARMPLPPREGQQWRVNFSRVEWVHEVVAGKYQRVKGKKEDNWVWSPQGKVNMHLPEHWGYVQFGGGAFRPDVTRPIREHLQAYYQQQYDFHQVKKRWATAVELPTALSVSRDSQGWKACEAGWCIRQDALVTPDRAN
ncbi:MAG: carbohydrate-binding family 9-like protein [Bryobacteraceae bacterium]|nr:carbohydrate-binding family 9-like protein [Bryobacteraceae bacterium]